MVVAKKLGRRKYASKEAEASSACVDALYVKTPVHATKTDDHHIQNAETQPGRLVKTYHSAIPRFSIPLLL